MKLTFEAAGLLARLSEVISDPFGPHKERVEIANSCISDLHEMFADLGLKLTLKGNNEDLSVGIKLEGADLNNDLHALYNHLNNPGQEMKLLRIECSNILRKFIKDNALFAVDHQINVTDLFRIREILEEGAHPDIYDELNRVNADLQFNMARIADASQVTSNFVEMCPHCEYEVGLEEIGRANCPVCGKVIATCAMCDVDKGDCNLCNNKEPGLGFILSGQFLFGKEEE